MMLDSARQLCSIAVQVPALFLLGFLLHLEPHGRALLSSDGFTPVFQQDHQAGLLHILLYSLFVLVTRKWV
jgi:hypothetical protein